MRELDDSQKAAMGVQIGLGQKLVDEHPEIADWYREDMTAIEIAERLGLLKLIEGENGKTITRDVARGAIRKALHGHEGEFGYEPYVGLIGEDELIELCSRHQVNGGNRSLELGVGIHGLSEEELTEHRSDGGKESKKLKVGIHAYTFEDRQALAKIANEAQGITVWLTGEPECAYEISQQPEFQYDNFNMNGKYAGKPNLELIAAKLNEDFHNGESIRRRSSVSHILTKMRRRNGGCTKHYTKWVEREEREEFVMPAEIDTAYMLSKASHFQYSEGHQKGKPKMQLIADTLNDLYHGIEGIRKKGAVARALGIYKKKHEKSLENL